MLFILFILMPHLIWLHPVSEYNCHCYAWHQNCRCHGAPLQGIEKENLDIGDIVTYHREGVICHSAIYVGYGVCKGKYGAYPVIYHPLIDPIYGSNVRFWHNVHLSSN